MMPPYYLFEDRDPRAGGGLEHRHYSVSKTPQWCYHH
jgi:hypothetical protein